MLRSPLNTAPKDILALGNYILTAFFTHRKKEESQVLNNKILPLPIVIVYRYQQLVIQNIIAGQHLNISISRYQT